MNDLSERAAEPGKGLYTIFPEQGTDTSATIDFIKSTVGDDDLHPWTDVHDRLVSWTVEVSPSQVAKLEAHDGIARVIKLEIPGHPKHQLPRQEPPTLEKYVIWPVDGYSLDQCNIAGASLKALLGGSSRNLWYIMTKFETGQPS